MNKILTIVLATACLFACGQVLASDVTNVALSCSNGTTIATINIDHINDASPIRFSHQTEEAKDGKPFRVIVDVLTARHRLGANNFLSLPDCPVKGIRSSQYAYQPEAIVRIVFDMEAGQVYRVDSDANSVKLYFDDKAKRSFAAWSTTSAAASKPARTESKPKVAAAPAEPAKKSATDLNEAIDKDRVASLEPQKEKASPPQPVEPAKKAVAEKPKVKTPPATPKKGSVPAQPSVWPAASPYGPYVDASLLEETQAESKPAPAPAKPVVASKTEAVKKTEPKAAPQPVKPAPVKAQQTPTVAKAPAKSAPEKAAPAEPTKTTVAQADSKKGSSNSRSTSRFRRSPAESRKIKGTMVAEFPKRLVIKYKSTAWRDPFATLIDETKTYDNPVERQVPNVEGLKLVGILQAGTKDNRALFEDSEGYGYILKTGDKVQKGYVLRVESDRVFFQIFEYGWSRTVALHLES